MLASRHSSFVLVTAAAVDGVLVVVSGAARDAAEPMVDITRERRVMRATRGRRRAWGSARSLASMHAQVVGTRAIF